MKRALSSTASGASAKEPAHFVGAFEVALGVGGEQKTRVLQRDALPDAGERVGERAAFRDVIMHVVHRDERQAELARLRDASPHFFAHIGVKKRGRGEPQPALERRAQRGGGRGLAQRDKLLALAELEEIVQNQRAIALWRAHIAARQHQAQPAIGGAVPRIAQDFRRLVGEDQPRADRQLEVLGPKPYARAKRRRRARRRPRNCGRRDLCRNAPAPAPSRPAPRGAKRRAGTRNWSSWRVRRSGAGG